jgi:hypothetical protein
LGKDPRIGERVCSLKLLVVFFPHWLFVVNEL